MADTVNISSIVLSNTFDNWRIITNLDTEDVNEIARGEFVKPTGNVTISDGYLSLDKPSGITLIVTANARISGMAQIHAIESDRDGYVYLPSGDVTIANRATNALFQVNTNTVITAANVMIANSTVDGIFKVNSNTLITASNVVISNTQAGGTFNVESNTTISAQKVAISNATAAATFNVTPNTFIFASANVSQNVNVGGILEVTANAYVYSNVIVSGDIIASNIVVYQNVTNDGNLIVTSNTTTGNLLVLQNTSTGNLVVVQNTTTGNLLVLGNLAVTDTITTAKLNVTNTLNAATGNITTLAVESLTVTNPIAGPAETDSAAYRLRSSQTTRDSGYFGVRLGSAANGNAWIQFDTVSGNVWRVTENSTAGIYKTIITTGNVSDSISTTDSSNVASLTAVKDAYDHATAAYNTANTANTIAKNAYAGANTANSNALNAYNAANNIWAGGTFTGDVNFKRWTEETTTDTNVTSSKIVDLTTGSYFIYTLTGSTTLTFNNAIAAGNAHSFTIVLKQDGVGSRVPTWAANVKFAGGAAPPYTSTASAVDVWTFTTYDGGTTYIGTLAVKDAR